jgi:hypothetical protein
LDPFLDFLRDYYEAGDNVHSEEGDKHSRTLSACLRSMTLEGPATFDDEEFKLKKREAFWRIVQENIREWWD